MKTALRAASAGILGLVGLASSAAADGPKGPPMEPEARARLDALIASYKALPAYADHGETTLVVKVGEKELRQVQKASVAFSRPNKLDVRTDLVRVVSDGATVSTAVVPLKTVQAIPAPKKLAESILRGGPLGAIEFGGVSGLPLVHVLNLVIGDEPERLIFDFAPKVTAEPDRAIGATSYRVLRLDEADNYDWRFLIDPRTGLLAFVDLVVEGDATKSSIAGGDTHVESLRWASGAVSSEVPGDGAFAFVTPEGFASVARLEAAAPKPEAAAAAAPAERKAGAEAHPLVGKPAPDFALDVLDGPGKLRKVTRADLAGKVVMIDFWATWCGPCLKELPDVQGLIESYAKAKKGVVVVALSIDQAEAGDLKAARSTVEATLKERKLALAGVGEADNPVGLVALDPLGKIAAAYGVEAIPFVVLIDAQGVIRTVHVGLTDRDVFAAEIDALLAGKPPGPAGQ